MSTAVQFSPTFVSSRLGMKSSLVRLMQRVCLAQQIYCGRESVELARSSVTLHKGAEPVSVRLVRLAGQVRC